MSIKNPNDSAHDEQLDPENTGVDTEKEEKEEPAEEEVADKTEEQPVAEKAEEVIDAKEEPAEEEVSDKTEEPAAEKAEEVIDAKEEPAEEEVSDKTEEPAAEKAEEVIDAKEEPAEEEVADKTEEQPLAEKAEEVIDAKEEPAEEEVADKTEEQPVAEKAEEVIDDKEESAEGDQDKRADEPIVTEKLAEVDYSSRSREDLVETLELLVENRPPNEIREDVDKIKVLFYKRYKSEVEQIKAKFIADGGSEEDFLPPQDELESIVKRLLAKYRGQKTEHSKLFEIEKQENLKRKYEIIDKIKDLVNREESINKTFQEFRDLQNEWYSLGAVPQSALKNLWETYNYNVEIFYDFIKINKELRDLDFKKNLELKVTLCEKAEALLKESNPVASFRTLQEYHLRWREIGPVPREERDSIWERFKEATSAVNKRHHEYFEGQKEEQKNNLDAKTTLCEKIEEINNRTISSFKEWEGLSKEVIELQRVWRTIGFAPKKYNTSIYNRFRTACDNFFQEKRKYYAANKEIQVSNLELKTVLCEKAEALQESEEWKEATETFIGLQKSWKEIGAVPRKYSDKIWKRFRKACDTFFERKSKHFSNVDSSFEENLKLKLGLIDKLDNFVPGEDFDEAVEELREIQEKFNSIGFVPFKQKDEVANNYRAALNKQFDKLEIDEDQKLIIKYQNKLDNLRENPKTSRKLRSEREKFINRIKQLEGDIVLWENNIGFFSKSSNADAMIKEVENKIDNARKTIEILEEKVKLIDQSGLDD